MSTFGDFEPEDSWDRGDTVPALLANLRARMELLEGTIAPDFAEVAELDSLDMRLQAWRLLRANPAPAETLRADLLGDDLDYVRGRI